MRTCSRCGEENPKRARFCLNCGEPLETAGPARLERKFATALFADLVGSTTLAEQEDPEVVQAVVGRAFDRLAEEIARYEGLLEKFMGDAVLAVFGVPRSHEDDADRAVRAALEMQAVLSELNRGFAAERQAATGDAHRRRGGRGARRRRACERPAGPDADGRRGEHRGAPAVRGGTGPRDRRPRRPRSDEGCDRVPRAVDAQPEGKGGARPRVGGPPDPCEAARRAPGARLAGQVDRTGRGAVGPHPDVREGSLGEPPRARDRRRPGGGWQEPTGSGVRAPRRGASRVHLLAPRPLSRVRQHVVLGAGRRDQGSVRDPGG